MIYVANKKKMFVIGETVVDKPTKLNMAELKKIIRNIKRHNQFSTREIKYLASQFVSKYLIIILS